MTNSPLSSSRSKRSRALTTRRDFSPFGNKLIEAGYADSYQLQQARNKVKETGKPLTEVLSELVGRELPPKLQHQYKQHQLFELKVLYGVESCDPEGTEVDGRQIAKYVGSLLPLDLCRRYKMLPLDREEGDSPALVVGMVEPDNLDAQDDLSRILRPKGLKAKRQVIALEDYQRLFNQYMEEQAAKEQQKEQARAFDVSSDLANLEGALEEAPDDNAADLSTALNDAEGAPIINLVNRILLKAIQEKVSDIHVEPQETHLRVRFRKDGVLQQAFEPFPIKIATAVAARFKIMANLDIAERRLPQDGRIRRKFKGNNIDFRVNSLPSRFGEKVVLRILDNSSTQLGLDFLITSQETLALVRSLAARPFGLILVTGPTGSGKSTTLYSILAERNEPGVNISTAEDPIEYSLDGITQVQVIREKGMDFASILRAFLRQDPDVILVGETRDKETAKTAIEAALTGHLVLTTLHTNDAAGAIARLDEMGVEPFMVSGALLMVLAQRLMRRVCSECRVAYQPDAAELARFGMQSSSAAGDLVVYKANTLTPDEIERATRAGNLCPKCKGVGYKGRVGVYEVMKNSEDLSVLINQGAPTERIKEVAVEEGMVTLLAYSLNLVREGYTTFEEVERVTFTDSGLESELKAKRKSSLTCRTCSAELKQEWLDCPYCLTPRFQD